MENKIQENHIVIENAIESTTSKWMPNNKYIITKNIQKKKKKIIQRSGINVKLYKIKENKERKNKLHYNHAILLQLHRFWS